MIRCSWMRASWHRNTTGRWPLSFRFNGHFPGEPCLAGVYWSKGWSMEVVVTTGLLECKAPVKSPPTKQHPVCTGRMPFLSPNQQCQSTEGKNITFHGLAYPKLTRGVFQLCLWTLIAPVLPWGGLPCLSSALWYQYPKLADKLTVCKLKGCVNTSRVLLSVITYTSFKVTDNDGILLR